jgi:hypothetical protein
MAGAHTAVMLEAARKTRALRELHALCGEVANNDPDAFAELVAIHTAFTEMVRDTADVLRSEGYSWADLAEPLGVSRQAAQQRFAVTRTAQPIGGVARSR